MNEVYAYIMIGVIFVVLIGAWIGMWNSNTDKMTDHQLYGMDADEYTKKMMGEEEYNKYFNDKRKN